MIRSLNLFLMVLIFALTLSCGKTDNYSNSTVRTGPYLGEKPPELIPRMFGQYLAGPEHHKHSAPAFSPAGQEMFFSVYFNNEFPQKILYMQQIDGVWTEPEVAFFSGVYQEGGPVFSPDGNRVYFYSKRPILPDNVQLEESNIWYIEKTNGLWRNPQMLQGPVNGAEFSSMVTSFTPDGDALIIKHKEVPQYDLYLSQIDGDEWGEPVNLGPPVNDPNAIEGNGLITPDGQTLIFFRYDPNNRPLTGLYMSDKLEDGSWSAPRRMGDMICNGESRFAMLSPDKKYLFFTSYRSGPEEIYWVDASIIDVLKKHDLNLVFRLTETIVQNGIDSALVEYETYKEEYSEYYLFDGQLLDNIGNKLIAKNLNYEAIAILNKSMELYPKPDTIFHKIKLAVLTDDIDELYMLFDIIKLEDTSVSNRREIPINQFGYELLVWQQPDMAAEVFKLNIDLFPQSANVYDSYAEAILILADTTGSVIYYQKSLELNPENQNAINVLKSLGVE